LDHAGGHVRHLSGHPPQRGLTLVELMIALVIAALLAAAAAPNFGNFLTNARLREGGTLLQTELLMAQSEAIKRNGRVRVALSGAAIRLHDLTTGTPVLLRERVAGGGVTFPEMEVVFSSDGRTTPLADVAIDVAATGVVCSSDTRCPGLRVDGGGAVRLCADQLSCT
jgi:type IV fimbrial biogenesis protein FimT